MLSDVSFDFFVKSLRSHVGTLR